MPLRDQALKRLRKKARKGMRGWPVGTVAFYGPDLSRASKVAVGIRTDDVDAAAKAVEENGGAILRAPYDDAHERRAVVYDHMGNGLVFYSPLPRS